MFKGLFKKTKYISLNPERKTELRSDQNDNKSNKPHIPDGLWEKCDSCKSIIYAEDLKKNYHICHECGHHFRIGAQERINQIIDEDTWVELDQNIISENPLEFEGYSEKVDKLQKKTELKEAILTGLGKINGQQAVIGAMDSRFLMGSMGSVVGEKVTRAIETGIDENLPVIMFTASGGARMQEGIYSLMQMAKTSAAISKLKDKGLPYIVVLTDPTTGGVTASFAMLGDIILAEPNALIGFAGKRVIEQTIKQKLPKEFQRAEFLLKHGFVDKVINRKEMRNKLSHILKLHKTKQPSRMLDGNDCSYYSSKDASKKASAKSVEEIRQQGKKLTPYDKVKLVRSKERPTSLDYIDNIFEGFIEFHGDRYFADDTSIVGGLAFLNGLPVTVIGQQKGRDLQENIYRNFGMPNPEGYRKAVRLMQQAEKFNRPIINFVDTSGAGCGKGAEERGQGEAIAQNLYTMSSLKVPIISLVIGEGGSGGALALTVADEVWMLENSVYSIVSPEGFASILWKDSSKAKEAADVMKITAQDLQELQIIDKILEEPYQDASKDGQAMSEIIKNNLLKTLDNLSKKETNDLLTKRYEKFRSIGRFIEKSNLDSSINQ
ncbi:acetyl-CoA carboxylase carboxyltransferase subunit alpha [Natranaerobius thermophilus]|uniref:Acetyl-coenzyme A carboxylase carboxyl transferase subunits beta/alpha n=1 Tax=Natranaerobius thermophilus (strain ATCC BAA-1301 / DSM 18059 / JW/NM-WN-LF) TaxID=457570 RepID=ACCDA_NATTJ|nr:acetyl-CoA carboxylase carboxyltransferase subunit alpha [Natranaerobius thermophilus]B2A865.1 RecName: Full=Acetyl-coenzyme A carboxylase carboxyl transferase subunits beta/alpha; Short=ACCase subunits beta/alpha; Short=Acetyl-CoA carboxylase carboxyltransferase subunits beta/alpha [Natranaerobius thermophilus JW/NM-WN-LF]ACB84431.1 acetyl-CoA carboxylase, carboxyl transferase, beta subunit [Natranaerobius thermophilus JW/NM-WN-LF]